MKTNTVILLGILLFFVMIMCGRGWGEGLPTPGNELFVECGDDSDCQKNWACTDFQCVLQYPVSDVCNGNEVVSHGSPSFWKDPSMQHMTKAGCSNNNQCRTWPPESYKGENINCCLNTGRCYT